MQNLRHLSLSEIQNFLVQNQEKPFRAKQIYEWLWAKNVATFEEMSNLSKELREKLTAQFTINKITIDQMQQSADGTIKNRFMLHDNSIIEGVLIPASNRMTACVSSQVGCSLTCAFCATGKMKLKRNVHFDEIYDQVSIIKQQAEKYHNQPLTNIVFMGMGEPLLNYKNVINSIERISNPDGLGMSPSRITVSTAGIAKMIKQLGDDKVKFNLAVSLHAANDIKRNEIMPINEANNLKTLMESLSYYFNATKNHITFEYILFNGFNDSQKDADELVNICRKIPSKVNIIEYNTVDDVIYEKANEKRTADFMKYLEANRVNARLRKSRGKDIDAACGQLANKKSAITA